MKTARWLPLLMFLAAGFAQAQRDPLPPHKPPATWPQSFNVATNAPAKFSVAVDKPSQIVVTAQFTGAPINMTLLSPGGQRTAIRANTSPATLSAATAGNETKPGMPWTLEIAVAAPAISLPRPDLPPLPMPPSNAKASGTVNVALNAPIRVAPPPPPPPPRVTPTITGLSKNPVKPGEVLVITGSGFGNGQNGSGAILLTNSPADQVSSRSINPMEWTDTRIRVTVPVYDPNSDHTVGVKTRWTPANGSWVESQLVALTIEAPAHKNCYGYHTRGDAAWQIACQPDPATCNASRSAYLGRTPSVEATTCTEVVYCYSFGDRVNNGPLGYKLNSCYAAEAACETDRKNRIIIIGGKDSSCSRSMNAGPPSSN